MDVTDFLTMLKRRGWLALLLAVLGAGSGFVFSRLQTPVYRSAMKLTVQPARSDLGLTQSAKTLLLSYIQIIWTERNAAEVAQRLQLDYSPATIYGNTKMADDAASFGIEIEVSDYDGDTANDIARTWADLLKEYRDRDNARQRREDRVEVVLGDAPRYSQYTPRTAINTLAGGLLGVIVGALVLLILERRAALYVRRPSDVLDQLDAPLLAVLPSENA